jgi:hypothetical protein
MDKSYVVFKCSVDTREPIICFDAAGMEEANDNLRWLRKKHAVEKRFQLEPGEFFEVLELSQMKRAELEKALKSICAREGSDTADTYFIAEHLIDYKEVKMIDGETVVIGSFYFTRPAAQKKAGRLPADKDQALVTPYRESQGEHRRRFEAC